MPATCSTEGARQGFRAPDVPGAGIHYDYGLASFDIRNVVHLSGSYELPFGKGKRFMANAGGVVNRLLGGWTLSWGAVFQGGQPMTLPCPSGTGNGTGCYDLVVPGQDVKRGMHIDANGQPSFSREPGSVQPALRVANHRTRHHFGRGVRSDRWWPWLAGWSADPDRRTSL